MRSLLPSLGLGLLMTVLAWLAWWQGWFAQEPVYHGRTVASWMEEFYHGEAWRRPGGAAADPAFQALLAFGSRAGPALEAHLHEPPHPWPWWDQCLARIGHQWRRYQNPKTPPFVPSAPWYSFREEQLSIAAGVALLALGTDHGGGMPPLIREYALLNAVTNAVTHGIFNDGVVWETDFPPEPAINLVMGSMPEQRAEIRQAIAEALTHTNPLCRRFAVRILRLDSFRNELHQWQPRLREMAASERNDVRDEAITSLLSYSQPPVEAPSLDFCGQVLANPSNSLSVRILAAGQLRAYGASASNYLPFLRALTNASPPLRLAHVAAETLRYIEQCLAPPARGK